MVTHVYIGFMSSSTSKLKLAQNYDSATLRLVYKAYGIFRKSASTFLQSIRNISIAIIIWD